MDTNTYPTTSLRNILSAKTVIGLRELAQEYYVKGYSRMRKADLVNAVCTAIQASERMGEVLYVMDDSFWHMFQRTAESPSAIRIAKEEFPICSTLEIFGYLKCEDRGDAVYIFVPDEVRETFNNLITEGFLTKKARFDLLFKYAKALVNLYGVISQDDFVALFNQQNAQKTSVEEMFPVLVRHIAAESGNFCFLGEYLVNNAFAENEFRDVPGLLARAGNRPRYIPDKNELLRYADPSYFEKTPHTAKLERFIVQSLGQEAGKASVVVSEIHFAIVVEAGIQSIFSILSEYDVTLHSGQLSAFVPLIADMSNSTRLWATNGYTPMEMARQLAAHRPLQPESRKGKIGRNEPCPCGSGKKYKKCCGR